MSIDMVPFAEKICQNKLGVHHITVLQHGREVGKFDFEAYDRRDNIHSATKSVVSLAAGIAMDEGLFTLDTRPVDVLPEHVPDGMDKGWEKVTVKHLLTMSSGHRVKLLDGYSLIPGVINRDDIEDLDWVHFAFGKPLTYEPGTRWVYNNACPIILGRMMAKLTGENLIDWLRPRFFEPMEIRNPQWLTDPQGFTCGAGGLQLNVKELARIGLLVLDKGSYKGRQIVPSAYVEEAVRFHIDNGIGVSPDKPDSKAGYGYFFWRAARDNAYCMVGWGGQLCIVLPDQDAVIALNSFEFRRQMLFDTIWSAIVPQLKENA
ncbi:MAG: serine hydrolase [Firmicutes bacterium]|nr:serine hydrolase [Bacillota bacterium]